MSLITHEIGSRVSRRELLSWIIDWQRSGRSRQPLKSTIIPQSLPSIIRPVFGYIQNYRKRPRYSRLSLIHRTQHTISLVESTPSEKKALHQTLAKASSAQPDIESIQSLLEKNSQAIPPKDRHSYLMTLLQHGKFQWIVDNYGGSAGSIEDRSVYLLALFHLNRLKEIEDILRRLDLDSRTEICKLVIHFLMDSESHQEKSLHFWILATRISWPGHHVVHQPKSNRMMRLLRDILKRDVTADESVQAASKYVTNDTDWKNFIHDLSYAYYMASRPKDIVRIWELTPKELQIPSLLSNAIQAHSTLRQFQDAVDLFNQNKHLATSKMKNDLIYAIVNLKLKDSALNLFTKFLAENSISENNMIRVLGTLENYHRFEEFDKFTAVYMNNNQVVSSTFRNMIMKRELHQRNPDKFYETLRDLYNSDQKPTQTTFMRLFEQFAKSGQIHDAMSLLGVLIQRKEVLTVEIFTSLVRTCEKAQAFFELPKVIRAMQSLNIEPDVNFRAAIMSLNLSLKKFSVVQQLFFEHKEENSKHLQSLLILLKSYLMQGKFADATQVFKALCKLTRFDTPDIYLAKLEFHCMQGHFYDAINLLATMEKRKITIESRHYHVLMKGYNEYRKYDKTILAFEMAASKGVALTSVIYHDFIFALVKIGIINSKNFERPVFIAEELLQGIKDKKLPILGELKFKTIKPLVRSLLKTYDSHEAFRIMNEFTKVRPQFDITDDLGFMKQEMMLFASQKKWKSFEDVYFTFQSRVKESLVEDGEAPLRMKKIYNSIIGLIYQYHIVKKNVPAFTQLFQDLIFVHGFTFDSNHLNWVTRRFVRHPSTIHIGLKLVEKRLIGGYIAKKLTQNRRVRRRRLGLNGAVESFRSKSNGPYLTLSYIFRTEMTSILYNHIINSARKKKCSIDDILIYYKKNYPRTMKYLTELRTRLARRERYMKAKKLSQMQNETNGGD